MAADCLTVLSLDPSSTCCGYALGVVEPAAMRARVLEAGRLRPKQSADAIDRVAEICRDLVGLVARLRAATDERHEPALAIVEAPGKPQSRQAGRASLWTYGRAVGAVEGTLVALGLPYTTVDPADWAAKFGGKAWRMQMAASLVPGYDPAADKGGDTADAICMLRWWAMVRAHAWARGDGNKRRRRA